jgi:ABC-type dipeptide/oligopeptide/nickel transport system ATPase component
VRLDCADAPYVILDAFLHVLSVQFHFRYSFRLSGGVNVRALMAIALVAAKAILLEADAPSPQRS